MKFMRMIIQRLPSRQRNDNNDGNDLVGISGGGEECTCSQRINTSRRPKLCLSSTRLYGTSGGERQRAEIILLPSPTDPNRVIIENLPRDPGRRRV